MLQRMEDRVQKFLATGAKVILLLQPPSVHQLNGVDPENLVPLWNAPLAHGGGSPNAGDKADEQMNALLRKVAAKNPHRVAVVNSRPESAVRSALRVRGRRVRLDADVDAASPPTRWDPLCRDRVTLGSKVVVTPDSCGVERHLMTTPLTVRCGNLEMRRASIRRSVKPDLVLIRGQMRSPEARRSSRQPSLRWLPCGPAPYCPSRRGRGWGDRSVFRRLASNISVPALARQLPADVIFGFLGFHLAGTVRGTRKSEPEGHDEDRRAAARRRTEPPDAAERIVHFWRWLGLITAGGLGLRLLVVVLSRHERVTGDGYEWSAQGNLNAAGHWFVSPFTLRPDALRPPGWAMVLTVWAWLGQHSWFSQQILACVIGSATVLLVGVCARQLTGDRAGLVAAGIAAGYAGLWLYERALLSEVLLLPEIAVFILLVYRFRCHPSLRGAAVLGGMCGVMAMTRSEQILIFPLVVLPVVLAVNWGSWRRAVAWLAVALVVLLVVLAPWTIFNLGRFQRPVLLSNGFGPAVATANCGPAYYGPDIGYGELSCLYPFYGGDQSITTASICTTGSNMRRVT